MNTIPVVDASDFPPKVEDYCVDNDISTHYQNDIAQVYDDGNVFSEWLKKQGFEFTPGDSFSHVAIFAT